MDVKIKKLLKAIQKNSLQAVQDIIDSGSGKDELDGNRDLVNSLCRTSGDSACHVAAQLGYLQILRYLIETKGALVNIRNRERKTPLHNAAQFSQEECIKYLLSKGADVNAVKQADWTPLMLACTKTNENAVKILLAAGADPLFKNKDGWNSFHIASRTGNVKMLELLVSSVACKSPELVQALVNSSSRNGRKPIHTAALHGNYNVIKYILENNFNDVNVADNCGTTPLMDACRSGSTEVIDLLVMNSGDLTSVNRTGYNCLHVAAEAGLPSVISHLVEEYKFSVGSVSEGTLMTPLQVATKENQSSARETLTKLLKSSQS